MKREIITSLAALALWGSVGLNFASAQFGGLGQAPIRSRPAVSPYINLGPSSAFYGIIKPQLDANRSIHDLQQGMTMINPDGSLKGQIDQANTGSPLGGLQTGHSASYFNYGHYFPMQAPGGSGTASPAGFGPGLGGVNPAFTGGIGGPTGGIRGFYGTTLNQPLIRP